MNIFVKGGAWLLGIFGLLLAVNRMGLIAAEKFDTFFDLRYLNSQSEIIIHCVLGIVYLCAAPVLFSDKFRKKYLAWHRNIGKIALISGLFLGLNALLLQFTLSTEAIMAVHGVLMSILFLVSLVMALVSIRRKKIVAHQIWMIRAFANALGASAGVRLFTFFAFGAFTDLSIIQQTDITGPDRTIVLLIMFFSSWLGSLIPMLSAEIYIARKLPWRTSK